MNTNFEVDTAKVEEAARKVRAVATQVQDLTTQDMQTILTLAQEDLEGSTAQALLESLTELNSDISKIASGLNTIQKALTTYAKKIKEADARIAAQISGGN